MSPPGDGSRMRRWWYWRANDSGRNMTIGHGSSATREGMVEQVAAMLKHSPHILMSTRGEGLELVIQAPEQRT